MIYSALGSRNEIVDGDSRVQSLLGAKRVGGYFTPWGLKMLRQTASNEAVAAFNGLPEHRRTDQLVAA